MIPSTVRAGLRAPVNAFRRADIRYASRSPALNFPTNNLSLSQAKEVHPPVETDSVKPGHAVISTFDLFSIGGEYPSQYYP